MIKTDLKYNSDHVNIVECHDISLFRNTNEVLFEASCCIPRNSLTFIVGENGTGKSSLAQTILGLLPVDDGSICLHSESNKKLILGYVPQSIDLPKHFQMTVSEYLKYSAEVQSKDIKDALAKVDFPLIHIESRITELSGGQLQKLLLAAELYRKPDVLFLDEPLANVDDASEKHIIDVILEIKNQGVTIAIITHDWQMVSSYADHVICLNKNFACTTSSSCVCKNSLSKLNIKNIQKVTPDPEHMHDGFCYIENI
ncbi:MAG: ATP-binding cassette domain-containing protein [Dehalococcoidia bacterium]